jgi:hypothetical protein
MTERGITVTFFTSRAANTKREERISIEALAERIRTATAHCKEALPWLKLAKFGERRSEKNSLRHDGNVLAISGGEGDYDGKQMPFEEALRLACAAGLCCLIYTSPSFSEDAPKWRILAPCSREYPPEDRDRFMARLNGLFGGIFAGESWTLSQAYYFGAVKRNPSHRAVVIEGICIDLADHLDAGALWPTLRVAQTRQRASQGTPRHTTADNDSLIAQIRTRLPPLADVLRAHGYAQRGDTFRHPNSQSGSYGLNVATFGGIARLYSHNGGDPLHAGNLPAWTAGVTAIDVVDVVAILEFCEDRTRALRELAARFHLSTDTEPFQRLWNAAVPLSGTLATAWLAAIGLNHLTACGELRFHPDCPHPTRARLPALVAAVRSPDGELTAIHRLFLRQDGTGLADIDPQRASLGKVMGGAIRLAPIEDVVAVGEIVVAADIEPASVLAGLLGVPAWAAGTAANLAAGIALPTEIQRVVVIEGGDGAGRAAGLRFRRERRAVRTFAPPGPINKTKTEGAAA